MKKILSLALCLVMGAGMQQASAFSKDDVLNRKVGTSLVAGAFLTAIAEYAHYKHDKNANIDSIEQIENKVEDQGFWNWLVTEHKTEAGLIFAALATGTLVGIEGGERLYNLINLIKLL